ncbi:bifunctional cytochrome P450/NADPH--P450 reductase [Gordonia sp. NPDC003376]
MTTTSPDSPRTDRPGRPIRQPTPKPLIGNVLELDANAPVASIGDLADEYGDMFWMNILGYEMLVATSREVVDELCDESRFDKSIFSTLQELRRIGGDGLFTAETDEPNWGTAHRILMPTFGPAGLAAMFGGMTDIADQVLLKWERLGPDHRIDVTDALTRLTLDTIALCSFGYRFNSMYTDAVHPFIESLMRLLVEAQARFRRPGPVNSVLVHKTRQWDRDMAYVNELADGLIRARREHPTADGQQDVLDRMLTAVDPLTGRRLSPDNVRRQLITFLVAGHETTSGMLSFTLHALLRNPLVLARARDEVDAVLGGRAPTFADVGRLPYLDAILKESLRLWPTATGFAVTPKADTIVAGYEVRAGEVILIPLMKLHRDPEVWENPETFDPDRFGFERAQQIPSNAWKPFGNGQRACIGRGFAIQESILFLARLLQKFDLLLEDPDHELEIVQTLTIKPGGLFMRVSPRSDALPVPTPTITEPGPTRPQSKRLPVTPGATGIGIRVLYGSEGGTTKAFAERIADDTTARGFTGSLMPLDSAVADLTTDDPGTGLTVIVTCSYEGQPPAGAKEFVSWLENAPSDAARGVRYTVFGCGNTDWARTYQAIPRTIDEHLERLGGKRIRPRGEANARTDFFGDFGDWYTGFWTDAHDALGLTAPTDDGDRRTLTAEIVGTTREPLITRHDLSVATIIDSRPLVDASVTGARPKHHVELSLPDGATYAPGDYLVVMPQNPTAAVDRALRLLGLTDDTVVRLDGDPGVTSLPLGVRTPMRELLTDWVELARPVSRAGLEMLAGSSPCPDTARTLRGLADPERYPTEIVDTGTTLFDLLERFPARFPDPAAVLDHLPALAPRQYSISSSPRIDPQRLTITAAVVRGPARSGSGQYEGVASTFLERRRPGDRVPVAVRPSPAAFTPPPLDEPAVLICAGSGLAPFRGFLQDRAALAAESGVTPRDVLLFFGCDAPDIDFLYRDELTAWADTRIVDVRPAFSERPENEVRFVQERVWADRDDVRRLLDAGARVFVCGDGERMAPAVRETIARIHADAAGVDADAARDLLDRHERDGRYVADVFA